MDNAKHTALPWKWDNDHNEDPIRLISGKDTIVLEAWGLYCDDLGLDLDKANAEYIVRACNSHEELVEVAKLVQYEHKVGMFTASTRDKLDKAISHAEGN